MQGIENFSISFESFSSPKNCEFFSCSIDASEIKIDWSLYPRESYLKTTPK
jgi:hypothetical protein